MERVLGACDADLFDAQMLAALRSADQSFLAHVADGRPMSTTHRMSQGGVMREFQVTRFAAPALAALGDQAGELASAERAPPTKLISLWIDRSATTQRDARLQQALQQLEQQQRRLEALEQVSPQAASESAGLWAARNITPGLFDDQLRREMDLSKREHRQFALVLLAIDTPMCSPTVEPGAVASSFSRLSLARQRMVESLAFLLKTNIRAMDFTCRIADEGFAVLLSGVGLATATARMEQIRRQCAAQSVVLEGQDWRFSVSIGVASFPLTAQTETDLLKSAQAALAKATQRGGHQIALAGVHFKQPQALA
jgi:PleD family two-component response regulator